MIQSLYQKSNFSEVMLDTVTYVQKIFFAERLNNLLGLDTQEYLIILEF